MMTTTPATPEDLGVPPHRPAWRFLGVIGLGYTAGVVGGSSCHFFNAFRSSPSGQQFTSGINRVHANALRAGGSCAFYGGLFTATEWSLRVQRQKDDLWNSVVAATISGLFYNMRRGNIPASKFGVCSGVAVCMVEGVYLMVRPPADQTTSFYSAILGGPKAITNAHSAHKH